MNSFLPTDPRRYMQILIRALFLCFVMASASIAESGKIEVVGPAAVDFGKHPAWEKKVARYKIKNAGDIDLKIIKVRKTCGCASATASKNVLKPGETGVVEVVILPNSIFKLYSKNTFVESSDPNNRLLKLNVAGNAVPLVEVSPKSDVYAGRIKSRMPWSQTFVLKGASDLVLGEPKTECNYDMNVSINKVSDGEYHLSANMKPSEKSGDMKCAITVPVKKPLLDDKKHDPVKLSIAGRVGYELSVVPGTARMSLSDHTATKRFSFRVLGQRSRILKPAELKLPERDDVEFEVTQDRGGRYLRVKATFSPEFSKMLYTEEAVPLEFSVPGAASANIVCKIRK